MELICQEVLAKLDENRARVLLCLGQLNDEAIWSRPRPEMNSVGNLCLHLAGNESHYIGYCIGQSGYVRQRSSEFTTTGGVLKSELEERLEAARATTRSVLQRVRAEQFSDIVDADYPENEERTVLRMILHVCEHYAYHTGQVILLTRMAQEGGERLLQWGH